MASTPLIKILADGQLHSGQELADTLGISRTAIWKQLAQLHELGLEVKRLRGQGYRLARALDLLEANRILAGLSPLRRSQIELNLFESLPSTNDFLLRRELGRAPFSICIAEQQTAGKGRRGRLWLSPFAKNLYLSLAFDSARGVSGLDGLSLVIGLAIVRALEAAGVDRLGIKWPNDIWLGEKKLAGILVELAGELQTRCRVVIGLGLNIYMDPEDATAIDQPWTSLSAAGAVPMGGRNTIATLLLDKLLATLEQFEEQGFDAFRQDWAQYDALRGRQLHIPGRDISGVGVGIDHKGAYCVETSNGPVYLNAGEVSIRASQTV